MVTDLPAGMALEYVAGIQFWFDGFWVKMVSLLLLVCLFYGPDLDFWFVFVFWSLLDLVVARIECLHCLLVHSVDEKK